MSLILGLAALTLGHCLPSLPTAPKAADIPRPAAVTAPRDAFDDDAPDEQTITALAAAVYVARAAYREALTTACPASTLDDISDALPEVLPQVLGIVKTTPALAEVLHTAVADRVQAYTAIEHSRTEVDDGYGYAFDLLVEALEKGGDPHAIKTTALDVPRRLRELTLQASQ